jgi:hypothetical protein
MERAQAFTLEGIIAGVVVVSALLFALQSVVVTPTTRGTVDEDTRDQLRQRAEDVLTGVTTANNSAGTPDMSYYLRYWDPSGRTFAGAQNPQVGYGIDGPPDEFGETLNATFTQRAQLYNLVVIYRGEDSGESGRIRMVYQGRPDEEAVVASQVVTLYDNTTLTAPEAGAVELWQYDTNATDGDDGYYPIPNAVSGAVYNVVEVRLIVW